MFDIRNSLTEWQLGLSFGTLSLVTVGLMKWYKRPNKFPPGPRGIPILGYLPFSKMRTEKTAFELRKRYGSILGIRLGSEDQVFLNDLDAIQEALVKKSHTLSGRFKFPMLESFEGAGIGTTDYGKKWKSQRKFALQIFREFGVGKKGMENICLEELNFLIEAIRSNDGKPFDVSTFLYYAISNNIGSIIFGKRYDYSDERYMLMLTFFANRNENFKSTFLTTILGLIPWLRHVPPFSLIKIRVEQKFQTYLDWISSIVSEHEETFDENHIRDYIDAFIQEKKKEQDQSFTNTQLLMNVTGLFLAGTETTSSTLYWAILCLLHYPETQTKLRKEILNVFGSSGRISISKRPELCYTNAFIQELYRFRTLLPRSVTHKANEDTVIGGFVIPKGTKIHPNLWAVHNDPSLWKDPETFNPERFVDEQGNFIKSNHVIPFSVGPRRCLGEQLASMEVFIYLVGVVQKFEILPDSNASELPDIKEKYVSNVTSNSQRFKIVALEI